MGMSAILMMWPTSFEHILFPDQWNLTLVCPAAWEQMFESDLWQKSNNNLDLWYSYVFMHSLRQLFLPAFSSKISIGSIKTNI